MKIYRPKNDRFLNSILKQPGMPTYSIVIRWIWQESEDQEYFSKIFPINLGVAMTLSRLILTIYFRSGHVWQVSPVIPNKWVWQ